MSNELDRIKRKYKSLEASKDDDINIVKQAFREEINELKDHNKEEIVELEEELMEELEES